MTSELEAAIAHHQGGRLSQAEKTYKNILAQFPRHPDALHLLGVVAYQKGDSQTAIALIEQAIRYQSDIPYYYNNLGAAFRKADRQVEALANYHKAIQLKPDYPEAAYNIGSVLLVSGNPAQAISWFEKAVHIRPDYVDAYTNLAAAYIRQNRPGDALACCQKALAYKPDCAEALNNMGNALICQGKPKKALSCLRKAISLDRANPQAYNNRGNAAADLGRFDEALRCYREALKIDPLYGDASNNMGILLQNEGRFQEAAAAYQRAIRLNPGDPHAYHNLGNIHKELGKLDAAVAFYNQALDCRYDLVDTHVNLGVALEAQGHSRGAMEHYQKALDINPNHGRVYSHLVHCSQALCAWQKAASCGAILDGFTVRALEKGKTPEEMPFLNLARHMDIKLNFAVARAWSDEIARRMSGRQFLATTDHAIRRKRLLKRKLTLGFLSNNFRNHPTAHLISGMFGHFNRDDFNIFCYSYGENDGSKYAGRIRRESDRFIDISLLAHRVAAQRINDDGVDILVDLVGYMQGHRLAIAALRPAPLQVRWLGHAGTTGANFFDYIITDPVVTPEDHAPFYSEKFVYMPYCYQINNNRQQIADRRWDRNDLGLPQNAFIFCCFCSHYKLDSIMFEGWMRILDQVPHSVLWLLAGHPAAQNNLKRQAAVHGIDPRRLVFAVRESKEVHLSRLQLADLALDTRVVNGAATTSDALWTGVPVLTLQGRHFASRMSASILSAVGLETMITYRQQDYEKRAVELALRPHKLRAIRRRLEQNQLQAPLFNTQAFVENLQAAFVEMWTRFLAGRQAALIRL
jgi:protein O-GlcNAc transferase